MFPWLLPEQLFSFIVIAMFDAHCESTHALYTVLLPVVQVDSTRYSSTVTDSSKVRDRVVTVLTVGEEVEVHLVGADVGTAVGCAEGTWHAPESSSSGVG